MFSVAKLGVALGATSRSASSWAGQLLGWLPSPWGTALTPAIPTAVQTRVRQNVERFALRGEAGLCVVRLVFCVLVAVRFGVLAVLTEDGLVAARLMTEAPPFLLAVGTSGFLFWRIQAGRGRSWFLAVSVGLDALLCFFALLPNVLFPAAHYQGLLAMPDIGALLLMVGASGLRQSPRLCVLALVLNGVAATTLFALDWGLASGRLVYGSGDVVLFLIFLVGMGVLAASVAKTARTIAERSSIESLHLEHAKGELAMLLDVHHGAKTQLSASTLEAQLLNASPEVAGEPALERRVHRLVEGLLRLANQTKRVQERSFAELLALREITAVDLNQAIGEALPQLRCKHPGVLIAGDDVGLSSRGSARAKVAGGRAGVFRILQNAVDNAAQGDGRCGASEVWIECGASADALVLRIRDDGPGFSEAWLTHSGPGLAGKPGGSGVGLTVIHQLAVQSGGTLVVRNGSETERSRGAVVEISLPRHDQTDAADGSVST